MLLKPRRGRFLLLILFHLLQLDLPQGCFSPSFRLLACFKGIQIPLCFSCFLQLLIFPFHLLPDFLHPICLCLGLPCLLLCFFLCLLSLCLFSCCLLLLRKLCCFLRLLLLSRTLFLLCLLLFRKLLCCFLLRLLRSRKLCFLFRMLCVLRCLLLSCRLLLLLLLLLFLGQSRLALCILSHECLCPRDLL